MLMWSIDNPIVYITGAASGIGKATAEILASHTHLRLFDKDEIGLKNLCLELSKHKFSYLAHTVDVSDGINFSEILEEQLQKDGYCTSLINNVGICRARNFFELEINDWLETYNVNFISAVRAVNACVPFMSTSSSIVNVSSDLAIQPEKESIDYQASKAALLCLTKALAQELGPKIRVNAVAPGPVWTDLWTKPGGFAEDLARIHNLPPIEAVNFEMSLRKVPLQRLGTPEEIGRVISFLASEATSFVSGSIWGVNGGTVKSLVS